METPMAASLHLSKSLDDVKRTEEEDLLLASTFPKITSDQHQPRRRPIKKAVSAPPIRQQSFSSDVCHAAAETYLVTSLSFTLLSYLG